jgi:hypothetical protein
MRIDWLFVVLKELLSHCPITNRRIFSLISALGAAILSWGPSESFGKCDLPERSQIIDSKRQKNEKQERNDVRVELIVRVGAYV